MRFLSFLIFIVLQLACLPLAIVGLVLATYRQMVVSKRLGVSQTGIEVLSGRWTMHMFEMREDLAASRLAAVLPNTSTTGLRLVLFPLWVKYKISGAYFGYPRFPDVGRENIGDLVVARTIYFDRIIDRLVDDVEQFVLLGAGYDTRPYGDLATSKLTFFELDQATTQGLKRQCLQQAGIDASHVEFLPVDFSQDQPFERLLEAGYDPSRKTLFLWEGVTLYLSEADVRKTLRDIRANAAPGSVVLADFYSDRMIRAGSSSVGKRALRYTNEEFGFGLPFETDFEPTLQQFVESEGVKVGETFFMGTASRKGPFMVVAELIV